MRVLVTHVADSGEAGWTVKRFRGLARTDRTINLATFWSPAELLRVFRDIRIKRSFKKAVEGRRGEEVLDGGDGERDIATSFIPGASQRQVS